MDPAPCTCRDEEAMAHGIAAAVPQVVDLVHLHVRRTEAARHVADYLRGLLADIERKNGWQLAEQPGMPTPGGSSESWPAMRGMPMPSAMPSRTT